MGSEWTGWKFKPKERVCVYATLNGVMAETKGTVTRLRETDGMIYVNLDGRRGEIVAHPKQCRRLKKRERRRITVSMDRYGDWSVAIKSGKLYPDSGEIEFVEVRRK